MALAFPYAPFQCITADNRAADKPQEPGMPRRDWICCRRECRTPRPFSCVACEPCSLHDLCLCRGGAALCARSFRPNYASLDPRHRQCEQADQARLPQDRGRKPDPGARAAMFAARTVVMKQDEGDASVKQRAENSGAWSIARPSRNHKRLPGLRSSHAETGGSARFACPPHQVQ